MPTVLSVAGYRFFSFSNERQEPAHIHVERAEAYAKFWLAPVRLAASHGFRSGDLAELGRLVAEHAALFQSSSAAKVHLEPLAVEATCTDDALHVRLADGREVSAPLAWFPALRDASPEARARYRLIGGGVGLHWPDLDEDVSVAALLVTS